MDDDFTPYSNDVDTLKENEMNQFRQESAKDRISRAVEHLKRSVCSLPTKVGEMKELLLNAIRELFGVRPSDKILRRYRELWHPTHIGLEPDFASNSPESSFPLEVLGETMMETESPEAKPLIKNYLDLCHTPSKRDSPEIDSVNPSNPCQANISNRLATPPLYMKVLQWFESETELLYR